MVGRQKGLSAARLSGHKTPAVRAGKSFLGLGMADRPGLGEEEAAVQAGTAPLSVFCV